MTYYHDDNESGPYWEDDVEDYGYEDEGDDIDFAEPGSNSALRAATADDPRDQPCPTCRWPNRLTRRDVSLGYQCNTCADASERGGEVNYYEE